jgi:voltage-gated potassium channel
MRANHRLNKARHFRASLRDTGLLLREFRQPLLLFVLIIVGCGLLYFLLAEIANHPPDSFVESLYFMLTLIFLQPYLDFPQTWYLQIFFFIMPIIGVGILAQGLTEFGIMLFNRHARRKEWEVAVASTFSNHVVLIGLGHLGYRVVEQLFQIEQDVVVIQLEPRPDLITKVRAMGVPVIEDDGVRTEAQIAAGIQNARSIILCTQNDSLNLQMALKARSLNPKIQVIIRIFDDEFATSLQQQFGFRAFSATGMAAPIFAASAANVDITAPIPIEGEPNSLARLQIQSKSKLDNHLLAEIEAHYDISVVFHSHNGHKDLHPVGNITLSTGDTIAVLGKPEQISLIVHDNEG